MKHTGFSKINYDNLFDLKDISDVPRYVNYNFKGGHRLRQAILNLIYIAGKPVTATQIRVAYFRKYSISKEFFDLSITQVSLLLRNLLLQNDIKRVKRGLYVYNKNKEEVVVEEKPVEVEERFKGKEIYKQLLEVFPKHHCLNKSEVRKLIKEKLPHLNLSENSFASMLIFLKKRNLLHYKNRLYSVNLKQTDRKLDRLRKKIHRIQLDKMLKEQIPIIEIARFFHVSPQNLRNYLKIENISRPLYKGTKIIDLKSNKIWYYKKDCLKDLKITSEQLNKILTGKETLEGYDIHRFKDIKGISK